MSAKKTQAKASGKRAKRTPAAKKAAAAHAEPQSEAQVEAQTQAEAGDAQAADAAVAGDTRGTRTLTGRVVSNKKIGRASCRERVCLYV